MPFNSTMSFIIVAVFGRFSQTWMPETAVEIGLKTLDLFIGFGSNVSRCDGPPDMNSRMQLLCLRLPSFDCSAARAAKVSNHPEAGAVKLPRAESFSISRRD